MSDNSYVSFFKKFGRTIVHVSGYLSVKQSTSSGLTAGLVCRLPSVGTSVLSPLCGEGAHELTSVQHEGLSRELEGVH